MADEKPKTPVAALSDARVKDSPVTVYELVAQHARESKAEHPSVAENAAIQELQPWQRAALLGRFKAQGLHDDARMPADVHAQALQEALFGRL